MIDDLATIEAEQAALDARREALKSRPACGIEAAIVLPSMSATADLVKTLIAGLDEGQTLAAILCDYLAQLEPELAKYRAVIEARKAAHHE